MAVQNTFASLVNNFADFLTVAIHTILYERHVYPVTSFISARKYNYPVRQSRHPKVCSWIADAVSAVQDELLKGTVDRVAVVIYSPYSQPLERFMFDLGKFPVVSKEDHYTPIERDGTLQKDNIKPPAINLEEQFRAVMAKLSVCSSTLKPVPSGCSFTVAIELKDSADPPIGHPQPWIPVQPSLQREAAKSDSDNLGSIPGDDLGGVRTTPIRTVEAGEMVFEMWIEEGKAKGDALESERSSQITD